MSRVSLESLVGPHWFGGCDNGILRGARSSDDDAATLLFILDGKTYLAIEDLSDGYRSYLGTIELKDDSLVANKFEPVLVEADWAEAGEVNEILQFTDSVTGQVVLEIGTGATTDYYPYFVVVFRPENMVTNQKVG